MPKGIAKLASDPAHTWMYRIAQPRLPGTPNDEVWVRGRVLGGSSSINGMIWSRGQPADYDAMGSPWRDGVELDGDESRFPGDRRSCAG